MCFSLQWLEAFLVWLIVICAVVALLRLLISFVIPKLGLGGDVLAFVVKAITIVLWAIVCIGLVYFIFSLVMCLGPSMPHLPGRP